MFKFYQVKIQLLHIEPAIWRRLVLASHIPLDRLHDIIQIAMGWNDCHLHEFTIGKKRYTERPQSKGEEIEAMFVLSDLVKKKGTTFRYLYDFGDYWEHEITLENSRYPEEDMQTIVTCLDGERACPPENTGGIPGYLNFCEAIKDPKHPEHEDFLDWHGGQFDSEAFDKESVNQQFVKYLRWSRERVHDW